MAFETAYGRVRPCVAPSPGSGLDSLPSEPFMIASISIDSRFCCILRFRRGPVDGLLGEWYESLPMRLNEGGGFFLPSDGFLVTWGSRPWDIPEADTDRTRTSGLVTERDCTAWGDNTTPSLGSSSSTMEST